MLRMLFALETHALRRQLDQLATHPEAPEPAASPHIAADPDEAMPGIWTLRRPI